MPGRETERGARGHLVLLIQVASLIATGWVIWVNLLVPRLLLESPGGLILEAVLYAVLAWLWSAAITLGLYVVFQMTDRAGFVRDAVRTASAAVWFAPAMILLSSFSPGALAAALILVISATRKLYAQWLALRPAAEPHFTAQPHELFSGSEMPPAFFSREMLPGLAVSCALQAGAWALAVGYPLAATALFVMSTALVTALAMSSGVYWPARQPSLPRSILGVVLTVLLAVGLTVGGVTSHLHQTWGWNLGYRPPGGLVATARDFLRSLFHNPQADVPDTYAAAFHSAPAGNGLNLNDGGFPGVVLWPEIKPVTRLVAPLPGGGRYGTSLARPMSIPFAGEYWMFKPPYRRPPLASFFRRGSPLGLSYTTVDHRPLEMEAHQKLDPPVDLHCCGKIQIEISNADRYPGTVALELVLIDATRFAVQERSLGTAAVGPQASQTLDFPIPAGMTLAQCGEFEVVFHRSPTREDKSARVAIERFVLVPRGTM